MQEEALVTRARVRRVQLTRATEDTASQVRGKARASLWCSRRAAAAAALSKRASRARATACLVDGRLGKGSAALARGACGGGRCGQGRARAARQGSSRS